MDLKILFATNILILFVTLSILIFNYTKDKQNKSLQISILYIFFHLIGFIFFVLRNQVSDFLSIILANFFFALGALFLFLSVKSMLKNNPIWYKRYLIPLFVFLVGFLIFTYVDYDTKSRVIIYYSFCSIFVLAAAYLFWTHSSPKFELFNKLSAILFLIIALVLIVMILQTSLLHIDTYYFSNKNIYMVISIGIIDTLCLWTLLALKYKIKN